MPTVTEYRGKLQRAMQANDQPAVEYFRRQIAKGEAMPMPEEGTYDPETGKPIGQRGSIADPIAQGVSLGFADEIGGGLHGLYNIVTGNGSFGEGYKATRDDMRDKAEQYAERHPYVSTGAELVSGAALPLGAARTVARGIGLGIGAGAVTGAGKNEDPDAMLSDVVTGGALGGAGAGVLSAGHGLFRAVVPRRAGQATTRTHTDDLGRLEAAGVPVTPAERIGSRSGRTAEKQTAAYLGTGDELADRPAQIRRALMERGGFDPEDAAAGDLSHDAVRRAQANLGDEYDNILQGQHVDIADMDPALARVERDFNQQSMVHEQKAEARRILDDFRDSVTAYQYVDDAGNVLTTMPGPVYQRIRSNLGKRARQLADQTGPNASLSRIYTGMQRALDEAFEAGAAPDVAAALRETNRRYRHFAFARENVNNADNIGAMAGRIADSGVDPDVQQLFRGYKNVVGRVGGEGAAEASGQLVPPVLSMMKTAGTRVASARPNLPQGVDDLLEYVPAGTRSGAVGQAAGVWGVPATASSEQRERNRRRRTRQERRAAARRRRDDDGDHEYR